MYHAYPPPSPRAVELHASVQEFVRDEVLPREADFHRYREVHLWDNTVPPVVEELKGIAQERGLWNLFLPAESGLTQLEYAPMAELLGWSAELGPEATNSSAPDTGNMELLHLLGTPEQQERWLEPLLAGEIRSAFAMTEPAVASSDATCRATSSGWRNCAPAGRIASWASCAFFTLRRYERGESGRYCSP